MTSETAMTVEATVVRPTSRVVRIAFRLPVRTGLVINREWGYRPWKLPDFGRFHRRQISLFMSIWSYWPMDLRDRVSHILFTVKDVGVAAAEGARYQFELDIKLERHELILPEDVAFVLERLGVYLSAELLKNVTVVLATSQPSG